MKLTTALACSRGLAVSCGLQSSFDVHTSSSSSSITVKGSGVVIEETRDIRYRGLPEKLTSSDRGLGYIGPEGT